MWKDGIDERRRHKIGVEDIEIMEEVKEFLRTKARQHLRGAESSY